MFEIVAGLAIALQRFHQFASEANRLSSQGQYLQAEARYGEALELGVAFGAESHPVALARNNLAALHYRLGRYVEARREWESAQVVWRKTGRRVDEASSLSNLAELAAAQGRMAEALKLAGDALSIQRGAGIESVNTQIIYAHALRLTGRPKEAAAMLRKLLSKNDRGGGHQSRTQILVALVQVDLALGNFAEAHLEAEEAATQALAADGPRSYIYAFALFLRGRAKQGTGDWTGAERDIRESLRVQEDSLGPSHPRIVALLADLADLVARRGQHVEAVAHLNRAMVIQRNQIGAGHQDYAALLLAMAHQRRALGDKEGAADLYRQGLDSASAIYQGSNPALGPYLNGHAAALYDLDRTKEAEELLLRAIALFEAQPDIIPSGLAESYLSMATICVRESRLAEARTRFEQCLAIRQHLHGDMHESLIDPLTDYAAVLARMGDVKRSRRMLAKAGAIAATIPEHRHTVSLEGLRGSR
jgi:tetratricopeptide (TPR) repeat protein